MRRLRPVAAAAAMLMLTGCEADTAPAAPATPASSAVSPEGSTAGFAGTVRERVPEVAAGRTDDEIETVGRRACTSLADGAEADAVITATRSLGTADAEATDHATARELIKLAVDTICPDQDRRVDEF